MFIIVLQTHIGTNVDVHVHVKIYNFMHVYTTNTLPSALPLGAVYLKNCIFRYWKRDEAIGEGEEAPYSIPEVAKVFIRENILGAVIKSPLLIW